MNNTLSATELMLPDKTYKFTHEIYLTTLSQSRQRNTRQKARNVVQSNTISILYMFFWLVCV